MSSLKLYLIIGKDCQVEDITTIRELDSVKQMWSERSELDKTAIIHCGFMRPRIAQHIELPENTSGKVLYSGAMKWALPAVYKSSTSAVTHINMDDVTTPCYLALNQWGYEIDEPEIDPDQFRDVDNPELEISILLRPVDDLKLSVSSANALKAAQIRCIGDLIQYTGSELLRLPNLGTTSLREINDALTEYGLSFELEITKLDRADSHGLHTESSGRLGKYSDKTGAINNSILSFPIEKLNLTIRSRNCLSSAGIHYVGQLIQYTDLRLLYLPNLGKTSLGDIKNSLSAHGLSLGTKLNGWTAPEPELAPEDIGDDSHLAQINSEVLSQPLIRHLERTLDELDEVDRIILQGRLGYKGEVFTLEEIGEKLDLTRQRVKQRQKKYIDSIIAQEYWDDLIGIRVGQLLLDREEPLILELLDLEDPWFKGFGDNFVYLANVLQLFSENAVFVIKAEERNVVTRISQNEWGALLRELRRSLRQKAKEKNWKRSDIEQYFQTSLSVYSSRELVPLLHEKFDELLQYEGEGPQALLIAYGASAESVVTAVLAQAEGPLHFSEIAKRASELLGKEVDKRGVHNSLMREGIWLFDRGVYGHIDHCPLPHSTRQSICTVVEHLLYQAPINKQWHSEEIVDRLTTQFHGLHKDLNPYILRMCIEHSPKITFLNRMVWARADSGLKVGDRIEATDSIIQILEDAGEPLSSQELKQRLSEIRGVAENMQIRGNDRLVAFGSNLWGLSEWQ